MKKQEERAPRKMRVLKKSRSKLLKEELTSLFSLYIRLRDKRKTGGMCMFNAEIGCGGHIDCCFHFVKQSRSEKTKWDERNAVGACFACNGYMENNAMPYMTWYAKTYGVDQMQEVERLSHGLALFGIDDYERMRSDLREKIRTVSLT